MSVPALHGSLTLQFQDGKLTSLMKVSKQVAPGSDHTQDVNLLNQTDSELHRILEALFAEYESR